MDKIKFKILGSGAHIPAQLITSEELEKRLGYMPGTIEKASGVNTRYHVNDETSSELAAEAAKAALLSAQVNKEELDAIVFVGGVSQQAIPSTAALIHRHLGLVDTVAFDINATCLGFLTGLFCVGSMISQGIYKKVLIVAADIASGGLDPKDPKTASLFGDGAAAFVLGSSESEGISSYHFETKSEFGEYCKCLAGGTLNGMKKEVPVENLYFKMNGPGLVKSTLKPLFKMFRKLKGEMAGAIDFYIPHQASPLALDLLQERLEIPAAKFMHIVRDFGNMIATSIPFALHTAIGEGRVKRGDRVMLFGTAAGLSIGGMVLEY